MLTENRLMLVVLVHFVVHSVGQITKPSFAGYTSVERFLCLNKSSHLEVIHINNKSGTILSPCWPGNYASELTEGFHIWNFNVSNQIAIRLTLNTFETNTINGVLYFGRSVFVTVAGTNTLGVTRQHNMKGSLTNPTGGANPFTFENTGSTAVTRTGNTFEFSDTSSFFMSFFSSLEPVDQGFNISYIIDQDVCAMNSTYCTNTTKTMCVRDNFDTYSCRCNGGFTGSNCTSDIDECATGAHNCSALGSTCTNMPGTFACSCSSGWTGNGTTCIDINECLTNNGGCGPTTTSTCTNTGGSFTCGCTSGYTGAPNCMDLDECATGAHNCSASGSMCTNLLGTFTCSCLDGWTGDGTTCADLDECATGAHNCSASGSMCTNLPGTFTCSCLDGWTGDGTTCADINECAVEQSTYNRATCSNKNDSTSCELIKSQEGVTCTVVNGIQIGGNAAMVICSMESLPASPTPCFAQCACATNRNIIQSDSP